MLEKLNDKEEAVFLALLRDSVSGTDSTGKPCLKPTHLDLCLSGFLSTAGLEKAHTILAEAGYGEPAIHFMVWQKPTEKTA